VNLKKFAGLSTSNISDALDTLGIQGTCEGIFPILDDARVVGTAFTVKYVPVDPVRPGTVGDFLDSVKEDQVVVIDNGGRTNCTVWGDIMTAYATKRRISGTVIDGVCRDVEGIRSLRYPIFTKGHYMRTGKDRVQLKALNIPISISGVLVRPGDVVVGDANGVVVIPAEKVEEIVRAATRIEETEKEIVLEIERGTKLGEARKKHGYHSLQRRTP
jgi:4-hydroxy-4-methyl-2-oxoglutarate aldolase